MQRQVSMRMKPSCALMLETFSIHASQTSVNLDMSESVVLVVHPGSTAILVQLPDRLIQISRPCSNKAVSAALGLDMSIQRVRTLHAPRMPSPST